MTLEARSQDAHVFLEDYLREYPEDVVVVDKEVSADQVITGIVLELWDRGRAPIVLCPTVEGLEVPVVTNIFASRKRIARLLESDISGLHEAFYSAAARAVPPRLVEEAPVLDQYREGDDVDLFDLPMLRHFEQDAGPYLTSAVLIAEDPETGVGNASYHRSMIASRSALATSLHSRGHLWRALRRAQELNKVLPVAVVIGGHPLFLLACAARVGIEVDERDIAGGLFGQPLEVVKTPNHGIAVPATADFVLEGTIDPSARAEEGPFGEFSGYASYRSTNNLLEVSALLKRRDAMLVDVVSGNTADHLNLGRVPRESELAMKIRERFPEVMDIEWPPSGTHFHCYVSLRRGFPGQARQVIVALLGFDPYLKLVIAVDEDVDIRNGEEVLWALATRFQADRDAVVISRLPGSLLDPSSEGGYTARVGLDATRGPNHEGERVTISDQARKSARTLLDGSFANYPGRDRRF